MPTVISVSAWLPVSSVVFACYCLDRRCVTLLAIRQPDYVSVFPAGLCRSKLGSRLEETKGRGHALSSSGQCFCVPEVS